jgi:S1-C subfamily serine protease
MLVFSVSYCIEGHVLPCLHACRFAIPVDVVKSSVDQILLYGKVIRPMLGIAFAPDQVGQHTQHSRTTPVQSVR